uniref:Paraoxonase n=1 Tax=Plectus sambesii TaxID=2011161 RepID=A0A914W4I2_9BILA
MFSNSSLYVPVLVCLLSVLCYQLVQFIMYMDLNKRVYNHVPGECNNIASMDNGAVDMQLLSQSSGVLLVSAGLRLYNTSYSNKTGAIYAYNITSRTSWEVTLDSKTLSKKNFNPHGISVWENRQGKITIFVVNHRNKKADTVEIFKYQETEREKKLVHLKTVKSPLLTNLRDVAAVGPEKFYATSYHYFNNPTMQSVEVMLGLRLGSVLYFDGSNTTYAHRWIGSPTGIALDKSKKYIYVASFTEGKIYVFTLEKDGNLTMKGEIELKTSPYNIVVDDLTSDLYVGCQPVKMRFFRHEASPKEYYAPSQIIKVHGRPTTMKWTFSEVFANDGATISGATVGVRYKNMLLIGSAFNSMLACNLDAPNLL